MWQAIGHIHRLGQKRAQKVWILFAQKTFDRFRQYSNAWKFQAQLAGSGAEVYKADIQDVIRVLDPADDRHREVIT